LISISAQIVRELTAKLWPWDRANYESNDDKLLLLFIIPVMMLLPARHLLRQARRCCHVPKQHRNIMPCTFYFSSSTSPSSSGNKGAIHGSSFNSLIFEVPTPAEHYRRASTVLQTVIPNENIKNVRNRTKQHGE
jgi:hypothetical protein